MTNEDYHKQVNESLEHDCIALDDYVVYIKDKENVYQVIEDYNTHMGYPDNVVLWTLRAIDINSMMYKDIYQHHINPDDLIRIPNFAYLLDCKEQVEKKSIFNKILSKIRFKS